MKCPRCEAEVAGRYCGYCGGALEPRDCSVCEAPVSPGHRFCSECGADQEGGARAAAPPPAVGEPPSPVAPSGPPAVQPPAQAPQPPAQPVASATPQGSPVVARGRREWWFAAAAVAGAALFLSVPYVWTGWAESGGGERVPMGAPSNLPAPGPAPGVDLSSMTPREAADRLFNRVMTALGAGDQAEVDAFLPMAIDAYLLVPQLDADGHFHLSLLHQAAGNHTAGLEVAERVLVSEPRHLLALYAAGEAARDMGNADRARAHFERIIEVFDEESARDLAEYREHENLFPAIQQTARDFLAGGGA